MSISNGLNKQPSFSEIVAERCSSAKEDLFYKEVRFSGNLIPVSKITFLKYKLDNTPILKKD